MTASGRVMLSTVGRVCNHTKLGGYTRYVFDLGDGQGHPVRLGCLSLPECPRSDTHPLHNITNSSQSCGCGWGGRQPFLNGYVWATQVCDPALGMYCHRSGKCSPFPASELLALSVGGSAVRVSLRQNSNFRKVSQQEITWGTTGIPGQVQRLLFSHCLPFQLKPSSLNFSLPHNLNHFGVVPRCGRDGFSLGSEEDSYIKIENLDVSTGFEGGILLVKGSLKVRSMQKYDLLENFFPVTVVCSLGGRQFVNLTLKPLRILPSRLGCR